MYTCGQAERFFCIGAAERAGNIDAVAGLPLLDVRAKCSNDSRPIIPRCIGRRRFRINPRANIRFNRIHANRMHTHHNVARARLRIWYLFELQDFRISERMETNRFRNIPPNSLILKDISAQDRARPQGSISYRDTGCRIKLIPQCITGALPRQPDSRNGHSAASMRMPTVAYGYRHDTGQR
jgi:hypothetical protein